MRRARDLRWLSMIVVLAAVGAKSVRAQGTAANDTKPQMMENDADPDWEVITVKPSDPNDRSGHGGIHGRHVTLGNQTVEDLLWFGYSVQKNQIANAPEWAKTDRWDVDGLANADGEPNVKQLQSMVREALAERFGLKLHREQREMPVFALMATKGGPKLAASAGDPNGQPNEHRMAAGVGWQMYAYTNTSMPVFALDILSSLDRPIVDQTGLQGRYDFQLKWLTDASHASDPDAPPGLFTAIQEQLGLKLEPKRVLTDVLAIDSVARPGAN